MLPIEQTERLDRTSGAVVHTDYRRASATDVAVAEDAAREKAGVVAVDVGQECPLDCNSVELDNKTSGRRKILSVEFVRKETNSATKVRAGRVANR